MSGNSRQISPLLVCEGYEDHCFFQKLIADRGLNHFIIIHSKGNTKFAERVEAYKLNSSYKHIKKILFVADNDDDPSARFANVRNEIEKLFGKGSAPSSCRMPSKGNPTTQILMLPWDNLKGTMESVCIKPARKLDSKQGNLVDDYLSIVGHHRWTSQNRKDKTWLRVNLAVRCDRDPFIAMGDAINIGKPKLIDFSCRSLKRIADYLNTL